MRQLQPPSMRPSLIDNFNLSESAKAIDGNGLFILAYFFSLMNHSCIVTINGKVAPLFVALFTVFL